MGFSLLTLDDWQPSTREERVNNRPKPRLLSSLPWYCLCDTVELVDQMKLSACWIYSNGIFIFHTKIRSRASSRSRLSAFVQISALFQIYITDMSRHLHHLTKCPFEVKKGGLKGLFLYWSGFGADFYADIEDFVQILCRFLHKKMLVGSSGLACFHKHLLAMWM